MIDEDPKEHGLLQQSWAKQHALCSFYSFLQSPKVWSYVPFCIDFVFVRIMSPGVQVMDRYSEQCKVEFTHDP